MILTNTVENPSVPCCDICDPRLLNLTRPGTVPPCRIKSKLKKGGELDAALQSQLESWRSLVFKRDWSSSQLDATVILDDTTVKLLACRGPWSQSDLGSTLRPVWVWWDVYETELVELICSSPSDTESSMAEKAGATRKKKGPGSQTRDIFILEVPGPERVCPLTSTYHEIKFISENGNHLPKQPDTEVPTTPMTLPPTPATSGVPRPQPRPQKQP